MATDRSLLSQLTRGPLVRPCDEPWGKMRGDERVRHCDACAREVFDISAMSALEAEIRLLNAVDATPCIRYARRSDGSVVHARPAWQDAGRPHPRSLAAVAALGVSLSAASAYASDPADKQAKAPPQCVAFAQPPAAPPTPVPAPPQAGAPQSRPAAAAPPAPAAQPTPPIEPMRLGGAPPPIMSQPAYGTLVLRSKVAREVMILGISLKAPLSSYLLTPGAFAADVREPGGKWRAVRFTIRKDKQTIVDLDKR